MSSPLTRANKALVERYFEAMKSGDPELPDLLSDDITWWVPESSRLGGLHEGKAAVLALMASGTDLYDAATPMQVTLEAIVAEEERVAVQLVIEAKTAAGAPYRNHYHFAFRLRDGQICEVREYVDTLYVEQTLFA